MANYSCDGFAGININQILTQNLEANRQWGKKNTQQMWFHCQILRFTKEQKQWYFGNRNGLWVLIELACTNVTFLIYIWMQIMFKFTLSLQSSSQNNRDKFWMLKLVFTSITRFYSLPSRVGSAWLWKLCAKKQINRQLEDDMR